MRTLNVSASQRQPAKYQHIERVNERHIPVLSAAQVGGYAIGILVSAIQYDWIEGDKRDEEETEIEIARNFFSLNVT